MNKSIRVDPNDWAKLLAFCRGQDIEPAKVIRRAIRWIVATKQVPPFILPSEEQPRRIPDTP